MTNYQTFDLKDDSSSPEHSINSLSNNNLDNSVNIQRDRSSSITSLEEVIINDPGYNGSLMTSVLTLCNTIFGAGMLTIVCFYYFIEYNQFFFFLLFSL